jgi:hypothetical protein
LVKGLKIMAKKVKNDIATVLTGMVNRFNEELFALDEEQLRARWYFRYEWDNSIHWNMYQFFDHLELYRSSCRRWEEHHNGYVCVVERVRDKYLMPKIKEFEKNLEVHRASSETKT